MIFIGSDHGGFELKEYIKKFLKKEHISFQDIGAEFYNTKQVLGKYNNHDATLSNVKPQETHKAEAIAKQIASKY